MDARDWTYLKVFVGLYIVVTAAGTVYGSPIAAWRMGLYVAILGTLAAFAVLAGKDWTSGAASS